MEPSRVWRSSSSRKGFHFMIVFMVFDFGGRLVSSSGVRLIPTGKEHGPPRERTRRRFTHRQVTRYGGWVLYESWQRLHPFCWRPSFLGLTELPGVPIISVTVVTQLVLGVSRCIPLEPLVFLLDAMKNTEPLIRALSHSAIFKRYERAFTGITGMPLTLSPPTDWQLAHHGHRLEHPFCAMMAATNQTCSACLLTQRRASDPQAPRSRTVDCFAGLRETGVPLCVGETVIGFLKTGEAMVEQPSDRQFARVLDRLKRAGDGLDLARLKEAWFQSRVLTRKQYASAVAMLEVFAEHLAQIAHQVLLQSENDEPPAIKRAKRFMEEHQEEALSLASVARAVHMSSYYFCKSFKKATGINFTEYLALIRIERAKEMLLNPNARVSEVAFETGFHSITNFNRTFKRHAGCSPSEYRRSLPRGG